MLTPRLTNCAECEDICSLIESIDCKVAEMSVSLYNNVVFMLNKSFNHEVLSDLLNYKRILQYKVCNPNYAGHFTVNMIASKVRRFTSGCIKNCSCHSSGTGITTTSTSTIAPITTTTTTTLPIICECYEAISLLGCEFEYTQCDGAVVPFTGKDGDIICAQVGSITQTVPCIAPGGHVFFTALGTICVTDGDCVITSTTTTTSTIVKPFEDLVYVAEKSENACGQISGDLFNALGDGTTFCNSTILTSSGFISLPAGGTFISFGGQFRTANHGAGDDFVTFTGGCDPCP